MATKDPTFCPPLNQLLNATPVLSGNNVLQAANIQGYPNNPTQSLFGDGTWNSTLRKLFDKTLLAASTTFDVPGITPQFSTLKLQLFGRSDVAAVNSQCDLFFNGDFAASYDQESVLSNAGAAVGQELFALTGVGVSNVPAATAPAGLFSAMNIEIPNYASPSQNKVALIMYGIKWGTAVSTMQSFCEAGFWRNNAAINRVTLKIRTAGNFVSGSRLVLWGL